VVVVVAMAEVMDKPEDPEADQAMVAQAVPAVVPPAVKALLVVMRPLTQLIIVLPEVVVPVPLEALMCQEL
jgi:hypothetical protein